MIGKIIGIPIGAVALGCAVSETFARKVDRNLVRPFRNYRTALDDYNSFNTKDDLKVFTTEMRKGVVNFFSFQESDD